MISLDSRTKTKLFLVGTVLAPLVVVQAVRTVLGTGSAPATASASASPYQDPTAGTAPTSEKPLTAAQSRAIEWTRSRTVSLPIRSPMDQPDRTLSITPTHVENPAPVENLPEPMVTRPTFRLTGMIGGKAGETALAAINHRIYRVGDEVVAGWKVLNIDARSRIVEVRGPDGEVVELTPPSPEMMRADRP